MDILLGFIANLSEVGPVAVMLIISVMHHFCSKSVIAFHKVLSLSSVKGM